MNILYLSKFDVAQVGLGVAEVIRILEGAFREKGQGRVEMPSKIGIHTRPDAFSHAMPAYLPDQGAAGIKWVSAYPENFKQGLPYISGLIVLNDPESGIPTAVMDCTWITAARTGAATALSAKYLARSESRVAGILACGVQGRSNLEALSVLFPLERVYAYDVNRSTQDCYVAEMSSKLNLEVIGVDEPRQAVVESDLVVTSGPIQKHPTPAIEHGWLKAGAFASSVDFASYWRPDALSECDRISTDDLAQFQFYRTAGYFNGLPDPDCDLGELVCAQKPARQNPAERTIAINLGLALEDIAVAPVIYQRAVEMGIGTPLEL
jgi:ornithine cyclodeaminase/alanine dehydrogenase